MSPSQPFSRVLYRQLLPAGSLFFSFDPALELLPLSAHKSPSVDSQFVGATLSYPLLPSPTLSSLPLQICLGLGAMNFIRLKWSPEDAAVFHHWNQNLTVVAAG